MNDDLDRLSGALPEIHALPRSIDPNAALEDRTVMALRAHGLLRPAALTRRRWLMAAAAAALFIAGVATGRIYGASASFDAQAPSGPMFALLLYGEPTLDARTGEAQVVDEYRRWAVGLREQGRYINGERLGDAVRSIGVPAASPAALMRGFFIVSARDLDEALDIARSCPHVRRGGSIVVRPLDPT